MLLNPSRLQTLLGDYRSGPAEALVDASYHRQAQDLRRRISAGMVALDRPAIREKLRTAEYFTSRKIDGEFTLAVCDESEACTVNPGGTVRTGLPLLEELRQQLGRHGIRRAQIVGELYVNRSDRRPRVHDVVQVARRPESQVEVDSLCFAVFDIAAIDGAPPPTGCAALVALIEKLFAGGQRVDPVETRVLHSAQEVEALFEQWVEGEGAEGLVARSDEFGQFKIKPRHNLDVAVIGFTEGMDDRAGMLHDLLVAVMRPEGLLQVLGRVGGGFTDDERRDWLSDLKDTGADSEYTEVNDQVAYQFVRPERVIEMSCLDLIVQNTRGATIDKMVLRWDAPAFTYRTIRRLPLCNPISPQFVRLREDKTVNPVDIRLQQVTDLVPVPFAEQDASALLLPQSELLKRTVYTKVLKGQTLVRKLLLWRTNKEQLDPDYPAYVAYVTDFSPNRAELLKRDLRVSNSQEQIESLFEELTRQYVVSGWQPA